MTISPGYATKSQSVAALTNLSLLETVRRMGEELGIDNVDAIDALNDVLKTAKKTPRGLELTPEGTADALSKQGVIFSHIHGEKSQQIFDLITDTFTGLQEQFNEHSPEAAETSVVSSFKTSDVTVVLDEERSTATEKFYKQDVKAEEQEVASFRIDDSITLAMDNLKSNFLNVATVRAREAEINDSVLGKLEAFGKENLEATRARISDLNANEDSIRDDVRTHNTDIQEQLDTRIERFGKEMMEQTNAIDAKYAPLLDTAERDYTETKLATMTAKYELSQLSNIQGGLGLESFNKEYNDLSNQADEKNSQGSAIREELQSLNERRSVISSKFIDLLAAQATDTAEVAPEAEETTLAEDLDEAKVPTTIRAKVFNSILGAGRDFVAKIKETKAEITGAISDLRGEGAEVNLANVIIKRAENKVPENQITSLEKEVTEIDTLIAEKLAELATFESEENAIDSKLSEAGQRLSAANEGVNDIKDVDIRTAENKVEAAKLVESAALDDFSSLANQKQAEKDTVIDKYTNLTEDVTAEFEGQFKASFDELVDQTIAQGKVDKNNGAAQIGEQADQEIASLKESQQPQARETRFAEMYKDSADTVKDIIAQGQEREANKTTLKPAHEIALERHGGSNGHSNGNGKGTDAIIAEVTAKGNNGDKPATENLNTERDAAKTDPVATQR